MIKACIFDCDGTLLDTLVSIAHSTNCALRDCGFREFPVEEYKNMVGDGAAELIRRCLRRNQEPGCESFERLFAKFREYFKEGCMYQVVPYDGITELLDTLKKRGILIAVLSNKPHIQTIDVIDRVFPKGTFDQIQGLIEEIPRKPAPDGALLIAEKWNVRPEECLYIGDTNTDMMTGNRAGMHTVGVLWGFRDRQELEENHAEVLVERPMEILELL